MRDERDVRPADPVEREALHRRYWGYTNRPYSGCGCLWALLLAIVIYLVLSLIFAPLRFGYY